MGIGGRGSGSDREREEGLLVPMMTVSALEKQSDTVPPRVSNKVAMTLLRLDKNRKGMGKKGTK